MRMVLLSKLSHSGHSETVLLTLSSLTDGRENPNSRSLWSVLLLTLGVIPLLLSPAVQEQAASDA